MDVKKIILGLILSMSFVYASADETSPNVSMPITASPSNDNSTDRSSTDTTPTEKPSVILPQDQDEIDAAPDDNEFDSSQHHQ